MLAFQILKDSYHVSLSLLSPQVKYSYFLQLTQAPCCSGLAWFGHAPNYRFPVSHNSLAISTMQGTPSEKLQLQMNHHCVDLQGLPGVTEKL